MKPTSHNSRSLEDLRPELRKVYEAAAAEWKKDRPNSPQPFPTQTYRSPQLQMAYYAQGRKPTAEVNNIRAAVGLAPLTNKENKKGETVTNAKPGQSRHQPMPAEAIDAAFTDVPGDEYKSIYPDPLFDKFNVYMQRQARKLGVKIKWGGEFRNVDKPHWELAG